MSLFRTCISLFALTAPALAQQNFADYWPMAEGHTWTYTDSTNPANS